jgi:hypothetical protein
VLQSAWAFDGDAPGRKVVCAMGHGEWKNWKGRERKRK